MASLNENGLRNHLDEGKLLRSELGIDVLLLSELKLDN